MNLARSTYYYRSKARAKDDEALIARIEAMCAEIPRYVYRRVTAQLRHEGQRINHKGIAKVLGRPRPCVWQSDKRQFY